MLSEKAIIRASRSDTVREIPGWSSFRTTGSSPALSDSASVTAVSAPNFPSAIWWYVSTMTATLIRLAVGNRMSPLTAKASPVSRFLTATPSVPGKVRTIVSRRFCIGGGAPAGAPAAGPRNPANAAAVPKSSGSRMGEC